MEKLQEIEVQLLMKEFITNDNDSTRSDKILAYTKLYNELVAENEFAGYGDKIHKKIGGKTDRGNIICRILVVSVAEIIHKNNQKKEITFSKTFPISCASFPHVAKTVLKGESPLSGTLTMFFNERGTQEFNDLVDYYQDEDTFADVYKVSSPYSLPIYRIDLEDNGYTTIRKYKIFEIKNSPGVSIVEEVCVEGRVSMKADVGYLYGWLGESVEFLAQPLCDLISKKLVKK